MTRLTFTTRLLKPAAFLASLGPAVWLALGVAGVTSLGADPVKTFQVTTGLSILVLLLVTLGISPARKLLHWSELIRLRRMLGLAAFFYALGHALIYFILDQELNPGLIWEDTVKHPRIAVGFLAFLLLIPLAVTSTDRMIRRLGKRWGKLHRLIYPATALGILHYLMVQKLDWSVGRVYGVVFAALMLWRVPWRRLFSAEAPRSA